jgi:hypothetical protein
MLVDMASEIFKTASDSWQEAMDRKDLHDAITIGMTAYLVLRQKGNERLASGSLNLTYVAIAELVRTKENDTATTANACSFCGRGGEEVRLGGGPDAHICGSCVAVFAKVLGPDQG